MAKISKNTLIFTGIICAALLFATGIAAWMYVQQQTIAQKNQELQQQKELKEKELQTQKDAANIEASGQRDAARKACQASGKSWFEC